MYIYIHIHITVNITCKTRGCFIVVSNSSDKYKRVWSHHYEPKNEEVLCFLENRAPSIYAYTYTMSP